MSADGGGKMCSQHLHGKVLMDNHICVSMRAVHGSRRSTGGATSFCPLPSKDLDPCFEACHSVAMLEYLRGNEDEAAEFFEDCMETFCGGM